jgi:sigma-B regulation protein RsbU (phosphoserine phosphatase)
VAAATAVVLFLVYDLLTVLLASLVAQVAIGAAPLVLAADPWLQFQGGLAFLGAALPLLLSVRQLRSPREFEYRWEDIPPHVRRIAERERQRVELETARNIQSAILPDLPPRLQGIDIAHVYLPASEVGGDFYDALALNDGRLAVAVGDVAGHGVSSGLVMSMAKSALAVQVAFDPEVAAVFATLNRVVFQSARRRLLATLCYALIDPRRGEMLYASAGHLFPYRLGADGRVEPLESIAYPLGVRVDLDITVRNTRLAPGDTVVLLSDGVVEARPEGSDEVFGFERLERSLERQAGQSPEALRDGLLDELRRFTGDAPREDDLTLLVLRLPIG